MMRPKEQSRQSFLKMAERHRTYTCEPGNKLWGQYAFEQEATASLELPVIYGFTTRETLSETTAVVLSLLNALDCQGSTRVNDANAVVDTKMDVRVDNLSCSGIIDVMTFKYIAEKNMKANLHTLVIPTWYRKVRALSIDRPTTRYFTHDEHWSKKSFIRITGTEKILNDCEQRGITLIQLSTLPLFFEIQRARAGPTGTHSPRS